MTPVREAQVNPELDCSRAAPTVSVITLLWRNERYASRFFESLEAAARRAQTPVELVAVENGPDGRAPAAALASSALRGHYVALSICRSSVNLGFSGGANLGCARANGDLLVVANLDIEFDPDFLDQIQSGSTMLTEPGCLVPSVASPGVRSERSSADAGPLRRDRLYRPQTLARTPRPGDRVPAANGCCLIFGRSLYSLRCDAVGGLFDPEYHSYYEDVDLFWWMDRHDIPAWWVPTVKLVHYQGGSFDGKVSFSERTPELRASIIANYRLTVWRNVGHPIQLLFWFLGEFGYVTKCLIYQGPSGTVTYIKSWFLTARRIRTIRARRGAWR